MTDQSSITYADAGVDVAEGALAVDAIKDTVRTTYRDEVRGDIGGFGGLFSLAAAKSMEDPLLVSGTDGVGTKLAVASRFDRTDTVGIDLVAMCANDVVATGAEPLFFLDYIAVGKLEASMMASVVSGIAAGCRMAHCALIGGEMAEHPGVMAPRDYDLAGFCVGLIDRSDLLSTDRVHAGDSLLGLASSGFHSNGYSLVRKVCVDGVSDEELLRPRPELNDRSLADALLEPTRIYVTNVLAALKAFPNAIHGVAHITGGGITLNLDRVLPADLDALVNCSAWPVPPVITYGCNQAHLSDEEALKTFNMGLGMILVVDPEAMPAVKAKLESLGEVCYEVGSVQSGGSGIVRYEGTLNY